MSLRIWSYFAITLCLITSGCIPKNTKRAQEPPVHTAVRTETIVITPIVTGTSLMKSNVREVASSKSDIVDVLPKGTQVELTGKNGNWYHVKRINSQAKSGFVYHKLIALDFDNYLGTKGKNKQSALVYNAPSEKAKTAIKIMARTPFDIVGYENGFYKVKGEHFKGYLKADLCVADPSSAIAKTKTVTISSSGNTGKIQKIKNGQYAVPPQKAQSSKKYASKKTSKTKFRSSSSSSKKRTAIKKRSSSEPNAAATLFGAFASALLGGGSQNRAVRPQSQNDALKDILKSISAGKELAQQTVKIREQMLGALNETRALQSLIGATVAAMNTNYKIAEQTARGVSSTGMKKISIKAFIQDLSYEPTESIESAAVKIAQNGKRLKALESRIKSEADTFSQLNSQQLQNMDSIIDSFSTNLHASNALYDFSIAKSNNVILRIDRAVTAYDEKAGPMAAEATKQAGIIALATAQLVSQISNAQSNPLGALTALPRLMEIQEELTTLSGLFQDFQADYEYIENNSAIISKQGQDISRIIMTARRKNTQITTMLESYYQKKLSLSKRLKSKLARQTESGYKTVEKKASSVALAEDLLD
ncbi:SH3 domain-containing protein [Maridesulfovibrio hydrothermalis]|uniref:SH3 type 3 domain protein n=1 Tax=Maridesulfovibrio hydrothermalis AM13 = DSM 14728 TaxID=1121451 RepID=L0RG20_9BACT|nr:SH3 domain-containing protein [Maridesulfovibrio hydrothermalis]CCO25182.1 SH3 type 3 domain protein [Maridesulfovibrio hydrothermalis AM13 = DSM 14728]